MKATDNCESKVSNVGRVFSVGPERVVRTLLVKFLVLFLCEPPFTAPKGRRNILAVKNNKLPLRNVTDVLLAVPFITALEPLLVRHDSRSAESGIAVFLDINTREEPARVTSGGAGPC